jgi:hypothetical protein
MLRVLFPLLVTEGILIPRGGVMISMEPQERRYV